MLGAYAGQFLPLVGGEMGGPIAMGGSNISGGGTATFTTFIGGLTGHASFDLLASNNLSDLPSAATARSNLQLGSAAVANTGTANGDVPVISGGMIPGSIIPTLNQNTTGTAANVTGTVAIASGGTGATSASAALTSLGALALAGGTMTGTLNLGGQSITNVKNISDNQSSSKTRISTGGATGAGNTNINDLNGTAQISVSSNLVTIDNALTVDGLFTAGAGMLLDGGATINGAITFGGNATADFNVTVEETLTAGLFQAASFTANNAIYVDGTNGDDGSNGSQSTPFATIQQAASVAVPGGQIIVAAGTYTGHVALPAGVNLLGAGREVTLIQQYAGTGTGPALSIGGSNCLVKDLTLDASDPTSAHAGVTVIIASGVTNVPTNVIFENVDFSGNFDSVNPGGYGNTPSGGTGPFIWKFRSCRFHGPCWMYYDQVGLSSYFYDCEWAGNNVPARPTAQGSAGYGCVTLGANNAIAYVYGGAANIVDLTTTDDLIANFFVVKEGLSGYSAFVGGTAISINCPNAPSTAVVAPFASWNAGANSQATITVGPGTSYGGEAQYGTDEGELNLRAPVIASANAAIGLAFLANQSTPSTPSGGGLLYASSGNLYWLGSSGTSTKIANA